MKGIRKWVLWALDKVMSEARHTRTMPVKHPKRPRDPAQLAKLMIDIASGEVEDIANLSKHDKNPAAVALGDACPWKAHIWA